MNVWASGLLLLCFVLVGPTLFLGDLFVETLIDYTLFAIPTGSWLARTPGQQEWQASWTVFYWGWWLA